MSFCVNKTNQLNILKYWHKLEFFIPFDLQRSVFDARHAELTVRTYSAKELHAATDLELWQPKLPELHALNGFDIYLGLFDKSELMAVTKQLVHRNPSEIDQIEQEERGDTEGWTCFARIKANILGEPLFDDLSISTAPWALGRIQRHGIEGLDFDTFNADAETLKIKLRDFRAKRVGRNESASSQGQSTPTSPLTKDELFALLELFYQWAGYTPPQESDHLCIVIQAKSTEKKKNNPKVNEVKTTTETTETQTTDEDDEPTSVDESDIDILNSFYAKDIQRAINSLQGGVDSHVLENYLGAHPDKVKVDLYQTEGRQHIVKQLHPNNINRGHWLDNPSHAMSLMQQFAINSVEEQLGNGGVFSANGPPGTGKTTLLRDLIANNVVKRATVLAKFETATAAFAQKKIKVDFKDQDSSSYVAVLHQELTGYEMILASSNNAAVENISRDLPKSKSLGRSTQIDLNGWRNSDGRPAFTYLQPIAHNLAAKNHQNGYDKLSVDDCPWGLISCALGKSSNRSRFTQALKIDGSGMEPPPHGFDPDQHQSIWTWRTRYQGISYAQARQEFLVIDQDVTQHIQQLTLLANAQEALRGQTLESYTSVSRLQAEIGLQKQQEVEILIKSQEHEMTHCQTQLDLLRSEELMIEKRRPGWWAKLIKSQEYQTFQTAFQDNQHRQSEWYKRQSSLVDSLKEASATLEQAQMALTHAQSVMQQRQHEWERLQTELLVLMKSFPEAKGIETLSDLELNDCQINGLWHDARLNQKRAQLFAAALRLHEAWLAEVLQSGQGFGGNLVAITKLVSGKKLLDPQHALAIWQSLFMIVPLVSCTFASIANQFRDIGANAFGWLFIDEAGQAVKVQPSRRRGLEGI